MSTRTQGASRLRCCGNLRPARGNTYLAVLVSGCTICGLLAVLIGASRDIPQSVPQKSVFRSALTQVPDCQCIGGISVDPIASAIPGTQLLESEGWRITNTGGEPLIIRSVSINGDHAAPLGASACGHIRRLTDRHYPVTLATDDSIPIFGYASNDSASFSGQVAYLVLDTDRGQFRYSPTAGLEPQ